MLLHVGTTEIISHIYSCIDFFHKELHDFEAKNSVSINKRIKLSEMFKLFQ